MAARKVLALDTAHIGRVGIWGRSGSGKSAFTKRRLHGARRVIVFDPMDEYRHEGFTPIRDHRLIKPMVLRNWSTFRIAYIPPAGDEKHALSSLSWFLASVQDKCQEDGRQLEKITLVVEELNLSFPLHGGAEKCTGFAELCSRGRARHIELIGVSQRIAEVSGRFRGNNSETVIFMQGSQTDRNTAAAEIDRPAAEIRGLEPLEYLHEKDGRVERKKIDLTRKSLT